MMQVTVKTLDSQTKSFSVPDEATVKEFKQQIEQQLEITADRQRLIFKGKVLQDEKKLQEYGVDGCVVHLVQRVPPSESQTRTRDTPTTSTTATGASMGPGGSGNFVMGAFTVPIDVMGVTQQIVQSLVNQLGVDSAQANISTTHSDDGAALNVHINLHATSQPGSDVGQRISRARNFLRSARESLNRTEVEGMLSGPTAMDTGGTTQTGQPASSAPTPDSGSTSQETRPSHSPLNLADILHEVQQISASLQPALDRYATLLSSSSTTDLQPSDDSLPDRIAETLHNLSHSYHALSDLTFNFRSQEPRYVRVLPPLTPHSSSLPLGGLLPPRRGPTTVPPVVSGSQTRAANGQQEQQTSSQPGQQTSSQPGQQTSSQPGRPAITLSVNPQGGIAFTSIMSTISRAMTSTPPASATSQTGPTTSSSTTPSTLPRNIFAPDFTSHTSSASTDTTNSTTNRQAAGPNTRIVVDDIIAMISGGPGPVISPQTATTSPPSSTATSSSSSQQQPQSTTSTSQSMHVGPSPVNANHPDPSVPCQSFHFGPQARSMITRQGSNQPGTTSGAPQARRHRPTTEEVIQQVREAMAASGVDAPEIPGQIRDIIEGDPNRPQRINPELFTDPEVPAWLRDLVTRAARDEDIGDLPTMAQVEEELRRQTEARERRRDHLEEELERQRQRAQRERRRVTQRGESSDHMVNDLLGRIMSQIQSHNEEPTTPESQGSEGGSACQTIGEMIRGVDNSQFDEPDEEGDVINPLFRRLTNSLTVPDLMGILTGSHEPFSRLRPELMMYLRTDLLHGAESTDENLKRAAEQLVDQIVDHIYSGFSDVAVKDGIDLKASLTSFLKFYIQHAVDIIAMSEDNPEFGEHFCSLLQDMSSEFFTLLVMCLRDGIDGLEQIVETRMPLSVVTHDLDAGMQQLFSRIVLSHVRQMYERTRYAEPRLQRHLIRITANQETAAQPVKPASETATSVNQSAAPEAVTTQGDDVLSDNSDQSDDFTTPPASIVTQDLDGDVAMEIDDARDNVDEDWKAVMPEEWVPIITRDIVRQRRIHPQAPFSDAYLAGVPPKRRKMVDQRGVVAADEVLPEALKRAASAAGVSPRTSLEAFTGAVGHDKELHHAYQKEIKKEVESRLEKDSDYKPEQFPNTREYFDRKSKRK